ncbi:phage tail protein [Thorsellia anophelis]|uniref:Phage tail tube protein, TTP n=1 Tax=Thorsellia anophelis DSM 18579 TaxID=1123402 RepID=A0A1I0D7Y6_9GAMM|nr:phage tail protein [Thorsellia anophelis]SET28175.1 Phage tail tube protein, TTP [Thorsellia anophelis DSM 18579]
MAISLPNGATLSASTLLATALAFSEISNAENAIVTLEDTHTLKTGDVVLIKSGWSGINQLVTEIEVTGDQITLKGVDTSNTNRFNEGGGIGSIQKIEGWTEISQIKDIDFSGGEQQTTEVQFLSDDKARQINTYKSPKAVKLTIVHDSTLPFYPLMRKADESQAIHAIKMYVPKASENRYFAGTISFDDTPTSKQNEAETISAGINVESSRLTFHKYSE